MTINITPEISAAYEAYLNEPIDTDLRGAPILRRNTYPYAMNPAHGGLIDFAAGWQAARGMQEVHNDQLIEAVAKAIYKQWVAAPGYVEWVEGGNSFNQDDARRLARKALAGVAPTPAMPAALAQQIAAALQCGVLWTEKTEAHSRMQQALADFNAWASPAPESVKCGKCKRMVDRECITNAEARECRTPP